MKRISLCLAASLLLGLTQPASANEDSIKLKDGPGLKLVVENCGACHSLDYIATNSPFLDRPKWDAAVTKMIKAFGAPIQPDDVKAIVDYLAANYGQ